MCRCEWRVRVAGVYVVGCDFVSISEGLSTKMAVCCGGFDVACGFAISSESVECSVSFAFGLTGGLPSVAFFQVGVAIVAERC